MTTKCVTLMFINIIFVVNIHHSLQCPKIQPEMAKAEYKSGEIGDMASVAITIEKIKKKMQDVGIFNFNATVSDTERKELSKLFDAVEIMTTSRFRQPTGAQHNMFSALRLVERAVKKQVKERQISESLASKFNWDKLGSRHRRQNGDAKYHYDKKANMRVFVVDSDDDNDSSE